MENIDTVREIPERLEMSAILDFTMNSSDFERSRSDAF